MSKIKLGINGFGRIGRLAFRAALKRNDIEIVGINDLLDVDYIAYMLSYDTVHGGFDGKVEVKDGKLVVNGQGIRITAEKDPANLKWNEVAAEYVIESTGLFLTKESAIQSTSCSMANFASDMSFSVRLGSETKVSGRFTPFFDESIPPLITFVRTSSLPLVSITCSLILPSSTRICSPGSTSLARDE